MGDRYNGSRMDPPTVKPGSVTRARMLAEGRQQRAMQDSNSQSPFSSADAELPATSTSRSVKQKAYQGGASKMISRPTQMPQFPIPEIPSPTGSSSSPRTYRPPANRPSQAPQRPPRPVRIPSMVGQTRMQEPTPLFIAPVRTVKSPSESTFSPSSHSQYSPSQLPPNAGYITEVPMGNTLSPNQLKKGVVLGPPPSSRRGASSFYSTTSYVSPIIEESPRTRSHGSYASSAAMPENWSSPAPENNREMNADTFYEESMTEVSPDSIYDDDGDDERRLVHPAELDSVETSSAAVMNSNPVGTSWSRNVPTNDRRASCDAQNASQPEPGAYANASVAANRSATRVEYLQTFAAASSGDSAVSPLVQPPPARYSRNSAMRRGLRIDMDAVREAESRGSMTSLPDLIRRATRLAAMIDKGKRPTSRMDNLSDFFGEKQMNADRQPGRGGRPPSGLSDMLAAFPPPSSTPQPNNEPNRSSWIGQGGWPLKAPPKDRGEKRSQNSNSSRRCCGLPLWAAILATLLLLCIIVAAIVVPLELFVFNKGSLSQNNGGIQKCQKELICLNGGTNVVVGGSCSCICSGGFTGNDCGTTGSFGCTTTDLVSPDGSSTIKNVTLGQAIPRLVAEANSNFSVPLSGTSILAKVNSSGLSCIAQNSLVTFNGESSRAFKQQQKFRRGKGALRSPVADMAAQIASDAFRRTTLSTPQPASPEMDSATVQSRSASEGSFSLTPDVVDFCRVAVLYVLQEQGVDKAQNAQSDIQLFFSKLAGAGSGTTPNSSNQEAANVTMGGGDSINLVNFSIDLGNGTVVGKKLRGF